jgi:hypothetical protein
MLLGSTSTDKLRSRLVMDTSLVTDLIGTENGLNSLCGVKTS